MDSNIDVNLLQKDVLVSTDISGQFWNVSVWDYNSGTNLQTYKNSSTVPHGLTFLKNDYMLCAAYNKPYIVCWNLKGKVNYHIYYYKIEKTTNGILKLFLKSLNRLK